MLDLQPEVSMPSKTPAELAALLNEAFRRENVGTTWITASTLELAIRRLDPMFVPKKFGYAYFPTLLANCVDIVEAKLDKNLNPPILMVRPRERAELVAVPKNGAQTGSRPPNSAGPRAGGAGPRPVARPEPFASTEIMKWAWMPDLPATLTALATHALDERWWFGDEIDLSFPILWNYLQFTFVRLKHENKIYEVDEAESQVAAFNTGLVDKRYEPIYALFRTHTGQQRQKWQLSSFCIAGEGRDGKDLVRNFNPLPQPPHYFSRIQDMIYDVTAGKPEVDWEHVIIKNIRRLPINFVRDHVPPGFVFRDPKEMGPQERLAFFEELSRAVRRDNRTYRAIKNRLADAVDLAVKRTRWNFKTAIPHYFPREHRVNLLLPLAVVSEDHIDLALVVEKTRAGNYLGHTILPLDWAYMHARLVCRPDSDWLVPKAIELEAIDPDEPEGEDAAIAGYTRG